MRSSLRLSSENVKRRSLQRRMTAVHAILLVCVLIVAARLFDLQGVQGARYQQRAQDLHFGRVTLPAKRGEILGISSKTDEKNVFATNTSLDLVYVDPLVVTDASAIANTLADILVTENYHAVCTHGEDSCPRELVPFYASAFDPVEQQRIRSSGSLLEPLPATGVLPPQLLKLPSLVQARDLFAENIRNRIAEKQVTFAPLKYGATKIQILAVQKLSIPGITVVEESGLVYADPQVIDQDATEELAQRLGTALQMDPNAIEPQLRARALRYVPVMRRLPHTLSIKILEAKTKSAEEALKKSQAAAKKGKEPTGELEYPLQAVALIQEHWRYYPDTTIASHVIGFLNTNSEPQYGVERTFNSQLHGEEGVISTTKGGQVLLEQQISEPKDGDSIVLTIDRTVQKQVETIMQNAVKNYKADSAQAIVMDPFTGRIVAMVNAPLFDSNKYATVDEKEPVSLDPDRQKQVVVEIFHPQTNALLVKHYTQYVFTASGRTILPQKTRQELEELDRLYDLHKLARYYLYIGENIRREIFPTDKPDVWLKFKNNIGLGAYLNRTVQEIYEPGSVFKPITMAIGLDQGEVLPSTTYLDKEPILVDPVYKRYIYNNDRKFYGLVNMTNCLEFSINTCMTFVSEKLGFKLFRRMIDRFGFGHITGIELEDELSGDIPPLADFRTKALLSTASFGHGISATPLQIITAWAALANGGKLMKPTIIDSVIHPDGTVEKTEPRVIEQVIKPETSQTITAMLVSAVNLGFAKTGKVPGYHIAGKTGTSQIAGPGGRYETGTGTTVATYAGYAPPDNPKFLVLVKIDRPKTVEHGATAAGPLFKEIATFLFRYYGIPPDEK